jgi:hypothetical protein
MSEKQVEAIFKLTNEPTQKLGKEIDREPPPRKLSVETARERDSWVEIRSGIASDVNA